MDIKIAYNGDILERNIQRETISPTAPKIGKRWTEISFKVEIKGGGSVGVAGKLGDLLEACGFAEVASVGSSVIYAPASGTMKSMTVYVYDIQDTGSAKLHKITGARGNVKISLEAGGIAAMEFSYKGIYNIPTDVAAPSSPTFESTTPPIVQSSAFTLNSITSLIVQALSLDMANEVSESDDISSATGIKAFNITGRKPAGEFAPEAVTMAAYDFWSDWVAATQRALSVVIGSVAGNICTITAPKVTIDKISDEDKNGIRANNIPFRCSLNAGNDEVQIKFT
jgi:hypothetical protein